MSGKLFAQPLEIADLHRHRPSPDPSVRRGRVGEADEPLACGRLEELHVRREGPVAGSLPDHHLVDERRRSPRSRLLCRHTATVIGNP
jgi:hypothetical protein